MSTVRKKLWPDMVALFVRFVRLGHRRGLSAGSGHSIKHAFKLGGEDDNTVFAPRSAPVVHAGIRDNFRLTSGDRNLFQLGVREEPNCFAIGRPKGSISIIRAYKGATFKRVEGPNPEQLLPSAVSCHEKTWRPSGDTARVPN